MSITADRIFSSDVDAAKQAVTLSPKLSQVDATLYEIAPGAVLPMHKHPFPRMGYMLAGTLRVTNVENGDASYYMEGDFALEAVDTWHEGENVGPDPVRLLVIDLTEPGTTNLILR